MGVDFDQYALGCVHVDLQEAGFIERRVEQREQALERGGLFNIERAARRVCQPDG